MQTSESKRATGSNHRKVQVSTTLNRKYLKRPAKSQDVIQRSPKVQRFSARMMEPVQLQTVQQTQQQIQRQPEPVAQVAQHPMQQKANAGVQARKAQAQMTPVVSKMTAKEMKAQAIQKALTSAEKVDEKQAKAQKKQTKKTSGMMHFGFGRVLLATACAATAVFAIVYFVNLNMPDISLRVAAMQTGMDPAYPNYIPRDYNVSSITSEEGKITMDFTNSTTGGSFTLIEEKSSWDTNALESNYIKDEFGENYTLVREQGLSIYISGSNAAWVNGGMVYKIKTTSGSLTNKQIRSIAVSL